MATDDTVQKLRTLREFEGSAPEFWAGYIQCMSELAGADAAYVLRSEPDGGHWKQYLVYPEAGQASALLPRELPDICNLAVKHQAHARSVSIETEDVVAIALDISPDGRGDTVAAFILSGVTLGDAQGRLELLKMVADVPLDYRRQQSTEKTKSDFKACRGILEMLVSVCEQDRFVAACMTLCNEIAGRYQCEQVGLGIWVNEEYIRIKAISQTARFDKKAGIIRDMEVALEEAADQGEEIVLPVPEGASCISRANEKYARDRGVDALCSIPFSERDTPVGALCCERRGAPFSAAEIRQISLLCELMAGRLMHLQDLDRVLISRALHYCRKKGSRLLGVEHTGLKMTGLILALTCFILFCFPGKYRVGGSFILKASKVVQLSASYDGIVDTVNVEVGDQIQKGETLLAMDREELLLQRVSAAADLQRFRRDAEKMRAEGKLADMMINDGLARQAEAKIGLIDYNLNAAAIASTFDGVVVEGDWSDRVGSPVRRGEPLFTVAQLDSMYIEILVDGADISRVKEGASGEVAFLSDPASKYKMKVVRIHPAASESESGEAVFKVRGEFETEVLEWWRPGMSGMVKIDAGRRSLWWIYTHRTADFLRRKLWW